MKIESQGLQLELSPLRSADAEGWCRVDVAVAARGFSGRFEAWLQIEDLSEFQQQLAAMYAAVGSAATATLSSAEPDVWLELTMHTLGGIVGRYEFESERRDGIATKLSGAFELDQSFLPALKASVAVLVKQLDVQTPA